MGFMKMGISLLTIFFASAFVAYFLNMGALLCVTCIVWFYGFFHARNMARLTAAELEQVEDDYIIDFDSESTSKVKNALANQKVLAWIFIVVGGYMIWKGFLATVLFIIPDGYFYKAERLSDLLERLALGGLIIWCGIRLVKGKKSEIMNSYKDEVVMAEVKESQEVEEEAGEDEKVVLTKDVETYEGGEEDGREKDNA